MVVKNGTKTINRTIFGIETNVHEIVFLNFFSTINRTIFGIETLSNYIDKMDFWALSIAPSLELKLYII